MEKLLAKIEKYVLYATVFLIPVTVLPISSNPFVMPKLAVLTYGVVLALLIRCIRIIIGGKLDLRITKFDFPVLFIAVSYLLSAILRTPNKMEAFLLPGTATVVVGAALLYFLVNQLPKQDKKSLSLVLFASSVLFSLFTLISFTGVLTNVKQIPAVFRARGFTPEGGYLPALIFLVSILPFGVGHFLMEKKGTKKLLLGVATLFVGLGALVSLYNILPGQDFTPRFPDASTSWSIAVDSLKNSPIFGVGPGNYLTAFNRFRPIAYNGTELWAVKFATAGNFIFTLMTEAGLLGTLGLVLLLYVVYKTARRDLKEQKLVNWGFAAMADIISLLVLVIAFILFPATTLLVVLFFLYLSFYSTGKKTSLDLTAKGTQESSVAVNEVATRFPALLITVPVIAGVLYLAFFSVKLVRAEYKYVQSLNALARNEAQTTYDIMREAINLNPLVDRYHATFARINLALANSIAVSAQQQTQTTEGATVSDQDRATITTLIQQSIAEAKSTVALNPLRAGNWEILGQTYRSIIPLAQGADAFSAQSYRQAIALDPLNPNLRIALGGLYYAASDYDTAVDIFQLAVSAKADHANARYNLAFALKENGNLDRAIQEMTAVLSLITDKEGQDFKLAQQALSDMQSERETTAQKGQQLNPPTGAEEPVLEPPIELPEGSEPPEAPISPTPTITPTPEEGAEVSGTPTLTPTVTPTPTIIP
ncbi:tetratricopeptide repeat protein [Patescibacteria group bacterium]